MRHTLALWTVLALLLPIAVLPVAHAEEAEAAAEKGAAADAADAAEGEQAAEPVKVRLANIEIKGSLPESPGEMSLFGDLGADLRKTISRLDRARKDETIAGVVLEVEGPMGRGKLNELRRAIERLQADGKKVYALLEAAEGTQYQLAAACDEIAMPESGIVLLPGVRAEVGFYKKLLDKLGIQADMMHVGEAKAAAEPFTRVEMSEAVRENLTALVEDLYDQMITTIAADRHLKADEVKTAVDRGLHTARQAKEAGLIDHVVYPDQFRSYLKKEYEADQLAYVINYAKKKVDSDFSGPMGMMKLFQTMLGGSDKSRQKGPKIAIVYAVGSIMTGESTADPLAGQSMGSTTIVEALEKAADDDSVKAIILRVDSPGGSALASDLIWRATQRIEKPIIASMGDVAGSGGYYISMGADRIFAEPATVTGSIGVVGGKFNMAGLYDHIGLSFETISRGENSGLFSSSEGFTESEREVFVAMLQAIYEQFTQKAAEGRGMEIEALKELAGGKVYTGRVAKRHGLVDEVGTLADAVEAAKTKANLGPDDDVSFLVLPEPQNPFEALFGGDSESQREASLGLPAFLRIAPELRPTLERAMQLKQLLHERGAVIMPYSIEIR